MSVPAKLLRLLICFITIPSFAQQKDVSVRLVQEDLVYTVDQGQDAVTLQQKTFRVQVLLQHVKGVYVFASFSDSLFRLPADKRVPGFADLPVMTMAEEQFNKEKELMVNDEGWSYWFYDPGMHWHRFNKKITLLDSGRIVGTKTIKQLYLAGDQKTIKLKENNRPLYLFFVAAGEEDSNGRPLQELLRRKIKIDWRNED